MPPKSVISLVVAVAENGAIGLENALPWSIPEDLAWFKSRTMGKPILMGRNTFDSIGCVLPGRRNMVISKTMASVPGIEIFPTLAQAIDACGDAPEICVIGGVSLFQEALPLAQRLYWSHVKLSPKADRFFPSINWQDWSLTFVEEHQKVDFKIFERRA